MVYERGGKVWVDEKNQGWVFLNEDSKGDRLAEDLVEEAGLLGAEFHMATPLQRAELGGYAKDEDGWFFYLSRDTLEFHGLENEEVYLLCDLNNWQFGKDWLLSEEGSGLFLRLPINFGLLASPFEFKFSTANGRWIEPHAEFPSVVESRKGEKNYLFDSSLRTGRDALRFRPLCPHSLENLNPFISRRPQGKFGYSALGQGCSFRIYAPRATEVRLHLFEDQERSAFRAFEMQCEEDGSWFVRLNHKAEGLPYQFEVVSVDGSGKAFTREIPDPYARGMISRTGPGLALSGKKNFTQFKPPAIEDCVIVEAHIRDLLSHADVDLSNEERMEFRGLSKWLRSDDCYLRKLGANVVELQPVQEFDARSKEEYHWGYMPVNFFSPASVYSSNPTNGSCVDEFSQLVDEFHQSGMAVVIDVVYNHAGIPPHLMHLDRELYFMTDEKGELTNHSGCGNDLFCDSEPVRKLILDSLIYWVDTFDVDGFRFDLGELLGIELLEEIENELKKIKPGILLFAEPWSFRGRLPLQMNRTSYALWSDACREGLLGFVRGERDCGVVQSLLLGCLDSDNLSPCQSVNYLESHDDYSLVDRFRDLYQLGQDCQPPLEVKRLATLATGLLLISPGVPMLSAGQDFLRHKQGVRNTYQRGDLNALDYSFCDANKLEMEFVHEMIRLRLSDKGLRARTSTKPDWCVGFVHDEQRRSFLFHWQLDKKNEKNFILVNPGQESVSFSFYPQIDELIGMKPVVSYGEGLNEKGELAPMSFIWFSIE